MIRPQVALAIAFFQSAGAGLPALVGAENFVRNLYLREAHKAKADEAAFAGHRGAEQIYSPSLLALIRKDIRTTPKGYVGKLDYDPICGCQDSDGITLEALRIMPIDRTHAHAFVTLFPGGPNQEHLTLKLVLLPQGWRVDDVAGPAGFKPLRSLLPNR